MRAAFTLVELAIVLVIIGLVTGGIMAGQNLIRNSQLDAVIAEYQHFKSATHQFKDKYLALPGDYSMATDQWGTMSSGTCPNATGGAGTETCDGDGDDFVSAGSGAANQSNELFLFWQHLKNAGLIEGAYTGIAGSSSKNTHVVNVNAPASKIKSGGWAAQSSNDINGSARAFDGSYNLFFTLGHSSEEQFRDPILLPKELWGIDKKIDDAMPATGFLVARDRVDCAVDSDGSALTTSAGDAAKIDAIYNLSEDTEKCAAMFRNVMGE